MEYENIEAEAAPILLCCGVFLVSGKLDKQPTTEELSKNIETHLPRISLASRVKLQVGVTTYLGSRDRS
jgi:hypothetical protein